MGIINIVKNAKDVHKDYIVLVKVGNFYNCYGRDAYIISYLLDYKITLVDNNIYNCSSLKVHTIKLYQLSKIIRLIILCWTKEIIMMLKKEIIIKILINMTKYINWQKIKLQRK